MGGVKGIMDIGSFLKLCKDFTIYTEEKRHSKRFLTKEDVIRIFKANATYSRDLNYNGFLSALDSIA